MNLPGFSAGAALYASTHHYYGVQSGPVAGDTIPQQKIVPLPPGFWCDLAYAICLSDAAQYQWDAHGECAWWEANCRPPAPPPSGGGGGNGGGVVHKGPAKS